MLLSESHAATIAMQIEAAGARIEFLDLHPDNWTATLAATTRMDDDVAPLLAAIAASAGPLRVHDRASLHRRAGSGGATTVGTLPPLIRRRNAS